MSHTLVVYYSVFGSTKTVAEIIANQIDADIKEIELVKPYSKAGAYTMGAIHSIHGHQKLPEIKNKIDITNYETIFVGAPVWNYTVNIALQSWLQQIDFTGKRVIPFCTNDGSRGDCFKKMAELCAKASVIEDGIEVTGARRKDYETLQKEVLLQLQNKCELSDGNRYE